MDPTADKSRLAIAASRDRQIRLAQVTGVTSRLVAIPCAAVSVALATRFLGAARYGVLATILSFTAITQFADLGLGNGLLTALSRARVAEEDAQQRGLVSTAAGLLALAGVVLGAVGMVLSLLLPWSELLGAPSGTSSGEIRTALIAYTCVLAISVPASLGLQLAGALQISHIPNLVSIGLALIGSVAVGLVVWVGTGLPGVVVAWAGPPSLIGAVTAVIVLKRQPELRPQRRCISREVAGDLLATGGAYFVIQAVSAIAFASDSMVIASIEDSTAVARYNVPAKLFATLTAITAAMTAPLWGAFAAAFAANDREWIRDAMISQLRRVFLVSFLGSVALYFTADPIIDAWTGSTVRSDPSTVTALACWTVVFAVGAQISTILNAAKMIRVQVTLSVAMLVVNLPLSISLTRSWGASGAVWGSVISYGVVVLLPYSIIARRMDDRP